MVGRAFSSIYGLRFAVVRGVERYLTLSNKRKSEILVLTLIGTDIDFRS